MMLTCARCEKEFERVSVSKNATGNYFCSRSCSASFNNRLRPSSGTWSCASCGKEHPLYDGRIRKYCDNTCQWNHKRDGIINSWLAGERGLPKRMALEHYYREIGAYKCAVCGTGDLWNDRELVLHFDHIDGDASNSLPENIRPLCPNCHSQTDTYAGRNFGNGRAERRERYLKRT